MSPQPAAPQGSPLAVTPPIQPRMPWRVVTVDALPDFRLHVQFVDGTEGVVDLSALVHSPSAGVFAALADSEIFSQVFIEYGAVTWSGESDLAPDAMYAEIKKAGTWVLHVNHPTDESRCLSEEKERGDGPDDRPGNSGRHR